MQELVTKATIEEMVAHRDKAIALYRHAFEKIAEADEAMTAAHMAKEPFQAESIVYTDDRIDEVAAFRNAVKLPKRTEFAHVAERLTDIQFWTWLIQKGELQRLMDKTAKDQLRTQLAYKPMRSKQGANSRELIDEDEIAKSFPPVTVENVVATLEHFVGDAGAIFRRGVAVSFSKLDRRFRSHDGFKIGSRIVLDGLLGYRDTRFGGNSFDTYGERFDMLQDIERAFAILDDCEGSNFTTTRYAIAEEAKSQRARRQFEVDTEYFKIRAFMNGNVHLWMRRDDLVRKVNKLLGEYYGEVVADGQSKDDPLSRESTSRMAAYVSRDRDLFPTPDAVRDRVIEAARLYRDERLRVLEPSAGVGNLAIGAINKGCDVTMIEIDPARANGLCLLLNQRVYHADFLRVTPDQTGIYDRVIMNPPFTGERDIDHVNHALKFLKPGGILVAVMSAGTEFRETKKTIAFRAMVEKMPVDRYGRRGVFEDLPAGSFSEVGTNCNTVLLTVQKPA